MTLRQGVDIVAHQVFGLVFYEEAHVCEYIFQCGFPHAEIELCCIERPI